MIIVLLWLIPTLGVLFTSFRPENLVDTTGWWTALAHPFRAAEWTLENYRLALDRGGLGNAFLNSLAVTIPSTVIPITIAAFAAYAFSWMEFKGRYVLFVVVVGLMVVPIQMTLIPLLRLFANGATIGRLIVFPDLDLNGSFLGIWLAHAGFGLPLAIYLLRSYIGSLPVVDHRVGEDRRGRPLHDLLEAGRPALGAGARRVRDLPVPVGVERPPGRATCSSAARARPWSCLSRSPGWWVSGVRPGTCSRRRRSSPMILPLIVFFSLQKYFVRGLTAGSVKG